MTHTRSVAIRAGCVIKETLKDRPLVSHHATLFVDALVGLVRAVAGMLLGIGFRTPADWRSGWLPAWLQVMRDPSGG
jgi:hypothetical protein